MLRPVVLTLSETWSLEGYFSGGGNNAFFQWRANSGEISFYQLEITIKTFFYSKVNRKISNFEIQGGSTAPLSGRVYFGDDYLAPVQRLTSMRDENG